MKYTKESIRIVQGEAYLFNGNHTVASTAPDAAKMGFIQLDSKAFVKPVDVMQLAYDYSTFDQAASAWHDGYKANPNEFTREDMIQAVKYGAAYIDLDSLTSMDELDKEASDFIDRLRPLSIPEYIVIEDNQVKEVVW